MYQIHPIHNRISRLEETSFGKLGFREREHLQEWIANTPAALGEDLLIIQKEFHGFADTNERLDLLALDKQGNLVVIENKLDDSGKDVTWQALKYASYCSSLTKEQIKDMYREYLAKYAKDEDAEYNLREFFENTDFDEVVLNQGAKQRIMLVAAKFRKEVTSTVLWLMNYNVRIQCFKVTPFKNGEDLFLDIAQILPVKEVEEYSISLAEKTQDDIVVQNTRRDKGQKRERFWKEFLAHAQGKTSLFQNHSPVPEHWIATGLGVTGVSLNLVVSTSNVRVEVYINKGDALRNKEFYDQLVQYQKDIEQAFGHPLSWERMSDKVTSRIKYQLDGVSYVEEEDWPQIYAFLIEYAEKLYAVVKGVIGRL